MVDFNSYFIEVQKLERRFIEKIPIYSDYSTPGKEKLLRKYLLKEHISAAKKSNIKPVNDDRAISNLIKSGKLKKIETGFEKLFYFHNVRKNYRYLTPYAAKGLEELTKRFQLNLKKRGELLPVKIAISSAIRPVKYQKNLRNKNANASYISTHSYGTSFDIFYDDYYVSIPELSNSNGISISVTNKMKKQLGFLIGDSLRRQFRSILMETLIQLQAEGKLYAILEKTQRCYHITIIKR